MIIIHFYSNFLQKNWRDFAELGVGRT